MSGYYHILDELVKALIQTGRYYQSEFNAVNLAQWPSGYALVSLK
ncbi:14220_t:CDS:2 [Funneliformis mosseae]|uniref:14220_t:CDS:1 n=1 Tax=Funneliformis mosseae TaxID=27381 RepID=A0A9N9FDV9_FUNMO|nr:14220_t:CDS:2 [Funneliformis mosseae]